MVRTRPSVSDRGPSGGVRWSLYGGGTKPHAASMTTEGSVGSVAEDGLPDVKMTPTSFRRSHVVTDPDGELAGLVFVLDFQEQNPAVGRLRDWVLARLDPR